MQKKHKPISKILSLLLTLTMALGFSAVMPLTASAAAIVWSGDTSIIVDDGDEITLSDASFGGGTMTVPADASVTITGGSSVGAITTPSYIILNIGAGATVNWDAFFRTSSFTATSDGGLVYLTGSGTFNMNGGSITSGHVGKSAIRVNASSTVNADIDAANTTVSNTGDASGNSAIYHAGNGTVTVDGNFTGNITATAGMTMVDGNVTGNLTVSGTGSVTVTGTVSGAKSYAGTGTVLVNGVQVYPDVTNTPPGATSVNANATAPMVGTALTGSYTYTAGTGTGAGADASTVQWYRSTANTWGGATPTTITGATNASYTPTGADVGYYLYFEVTPTNGTLTGTKVQSAASGQVGIAVSLTVTANGTTGTATINGGTIPAVINTIGQTSPILSATLGNAASVAWTVSTGGGTFTNAAETTPVYSLPAMTASVTGPITITATFTAAVPAPAIAVTSTGLTGLKVGQSATGSIVYTLSNGTYDASITAADFTISGLPAGLTAGTAVRTSDTVVTVPITGTPTTANVSAATITLPSSIPQANVTGATAAITPTGTVTASAVAMGDQAAPSAPGVDGTPTSTSITLTTITGAEYRLSTGAWQDSPAFSGLAPNTGYTFYARLKGTTNLNASPASAASATITTAKATLDGTVTISGTPAFGQTLTAVTTGLTSSPDITGTTGLGAFTYEWWRGGSPIGATGATYTLVAADIENFIWVLVYAANCNGPIASSLTAAVAKADQAAPALNFDISEDMVAITPVTGAEYKFESDSDATQDWSSTNTYTFTPDAELTLYIRLAETATHNVSPEANTTVDTGLTTPAAPAAFTLIVTANGTTNYTVEIPAIADAEYSFDGSTWGSTRTTTGDPGETVTGYARIAAVADVSNASGVTSDSAFLPLFTVATTYPVTVNDSYAGTTGAGNYTAGATVTIRAGSLSNYSFSGWTTSSSGVTFANANSATTTFSMPANGVTITANWSYSGGSGGGGGGSGGAAPPAQDTVSANDGAVSVSYTQSGGTVTADLPDSKITEIINQAKNNTASFDFSKVSGAINMALPKAALNRFAAAGLDMQIELPQGTVTLNTDASKDIAAQAGSASVTITLNAVSQSSLTAAQKAVIKPDDLVFNITVMSGTQAIHNFDGTITVAVPYNGPLPAAVWYLNDAGELETLDCVYDAATKTVSFTTNHLSLYVVGQYEAVPVTLKPWGNLFADVKAGDWFYNYVEYVYTHNLMVGTSDDPMIFSPNMTTTRAMIVTILYREAGSPNIAGLPNPFNDVPSGQWYTNAVIWAAANGIVGGIGDGKYDPDAPATRQDLAAILYRYANFMELKLPVIKDYPGFTDDADCADYAKGAIEALFKAGVIDGYPDDSFKPTVKAVRVEVAAMLMKFLEAAGEE